MHDLHLLVTNIIELVKIIIISNHRNACQKSYNNLILKNRIFRKTRNGEGEGEWYSVFIL